MLSPSYRIAKDEHGHAVRVERRRGLGGFTPIEAMQEWDDMDEQEFIALEQIRTSGRLEAGEPISNQFTNRWMGQAPIKNMLTAEVFCRSANRKNSVFFNDDMLVYWAMKRRENNIRLQAYDRMLQQNAIKLEQARPAREEMRRSRQTAYDEWVAARNEQKRLANERARQWVNEDKDWT